MTFSHTDFIHARNALYDNAIESRCHLVNRRNSSRKGVYGLSKTRDAYIMYYLYARSDKVQEARDIIAAYVAKCK